MPAKTMPILAKEVLTTDSHSIIVTEHGRFELPWQKCSAKLASAGILERKRAELSPSGYGIHWPLLDEDLAVAPLVKLARGENGR